MPTNAGNEAYVKLQRLIIDQIEEYRLANSDSSFVPPRQRATTLAEELLDVIWPKFVELLATIKEYEHALEHVADGPESHPNGSCEDCRRLAQSALDGVNREMCREMFDE